MGALKLIDQPTYVKPYLPEENTHKLRVVYKRGDFFKTRKNYCAFGALMPGRNASSESYRYGFNGMEKDDNIKGTGNSYDFGARMYDSRLGKFLKIDNRASDIPSLSPYSSSANNPIRYVDKNGDFPIITGIIGAVGGFVVGTVVGLVQGESIKDSFKKGAKWGVAGGIAGLTYGVGTVAVSSVGATGAVSAYIYGATGIIGAGVTNASEQALEMSFGERDEFSGEELVLSLPEGMIDAATDGLGDKLITKQMKKVLKTPTVKETYKQQKKYIKDFKKKTREHFGGSYSNKEIKQAAEQAFQEQIEMDAQSTRTIIKGTEEGLKVTTIGIDIEDLIPDQKVNSGSEGSGGSSGSSGSGESRSVECNC